MKRKHISRFIWVTIIFFTSLFFIINTVNAKGMGNNIEYRTVIVEKGDTLWNIIKDNCSNYKDIRKAVYEVKKVNDIFSANIVPGQKIKIPIKLYR